MTLLAAGCQARSPSPLDLEIHNSRGTDAAVATSSIDAAAARSAPSVAEAAPVTRCGAEMAPIPIGGCIDRWEASSRSGARGAPSGKNTTLVAESAPGRMPLANVTLGQASRACTNARKRLCTEGEWRSACKNTRNWNVAGDLSYAYGPSYEPRRCNDWHASDHGARGAAVTGSFPRCVTPTGIYDMNNNLIEWTSTPEPGGALHALRGGNYMMVVGDSSCDEDDFKIAAEHAQIDVGFRCCSDGK